MSQQGDFAQALEDPPAVLHPADDVPYYARRNDDGDYTWEGIKYPSVTTILSIAPGQHLMMWAAKQASLRAAAHLIASGLEPPADDATLLDFATLKGEKIARTEAVEKIFEWQHVMRESERYRDHKARIGSVTHHAIYDHAVGNINLGVVKRDGLQDYLWHIAVSLGPGIWRNKHLPEFFPSDEQLRELAMLAEPYVLSAYDWIELDKPEWEEIGQEAVIISKTHGYAGTKDARALLKTCNGVALPEPRVYDIDFKTSNSLPISVRFQVEAYRHADFIGLVSTGEEEPVQESHGIAALHIGPHADRAGLSDEYGQLASKAKQIGAKLHTADGNEEVFEGFLGLLKYYRVSRTMPAWDQSRSRTKATTKEVTKTSNGRKMRQF